ncbi:hypothetical protein M231_07692 [Tremella mesenterica]|uniref:Mannosyltransferase n=1 Tax=Tremella mesenterica TaxID=5217 RepID=A0A4Q1B8G9_TREME|nr:hypothetical protein M231_07692 [Tremella mesenterica]
MAHSPTRTRRKLKQVIPFFLALIITINQVVWIPYTKVEESFEIHAVHDFLAYGLRPGSLHKWDHLSFPGAVPRSFLPPVLLGILTWPICSLLVNVGIIRTKLGVQILIRSVLAFLFSATFTHLQQTVRARYGSLTRRFFVLFVLGAFHLPFYAGRTLPNFLALPFVMSSVSLILRSTLSCPELVKQRRLSAAIALLTGLATVIRLELAIFVLPLTLTLVVTRRLSLMAALRAGILGGFGSLALSAPLDYYLWRQVLPHPTLPTFTSTWQIIWPEASSMAYNVLEGGAAEWGIMSRHYYFTNSLPKLLLGSLPFLLFGLAAWAGVLASIFGPAIITMVGGMSFIGHKEWRFIVYVIPVLNLLAAITAAQMWSYPQKQLRILFRLGLVGMVIVNLAAAGGMIWLSSQNYPGGEVWQVLEGLNIPENATIHFSSYPLQTGASLFTFLHTSPHGGVFPSTSQPLWVYSKDETPSLLTAQGAWDAGIDYMVLGVKEGESMVNDHVGWEKVGSVRGFEGIKWTGKWDGKLGTCAEKGVESSGGWGIKVDRGDKVIILGRKSE